MADTDLVLAEVETLVPHAAALAGTAAAGAAPPVSLEALITEWLHAKLGRSKSKKTAESYTSVFQSFRSWLWSYHLDLAHDPRQVAAAAQAWAADGDVAPATHNNRLAIASSFYSFHMKRGSLLSNPISRVDRRAVQNYAAAQPLDAAVVRRQLAAIDRTEITGLRDYVLLAVALQTGRRLAELAGLRWGDLTIADGRIVTLLWRRAKGGKVMVDRLPAGVSRALLDYLHQVYGARLGHLGNDAAVWVSTSHRNAGAPLATRMIGYICEQRIGTSKVHALRHTFAHSMEELGAKLSDIQARLGHESLATTGRYVAALKRAENPQAQALSELFGFDDYE